MTCYDVQGGDSLHLFWWESDMPHPDSRAVWAHLELPYGSFTATLCDFQKNIYLHFDDIECSLVGCWLPRLIPLLEKRQVRSIIETSHFTSELMKDDGSEKESQVGSISFQGPNEFSATARWNPKFHKDNLN